MPRPSLPALTSTRFFAALVVFIGHIGELWPQWFPPVLRGWLSSGSEAVTYFFVLSGFIIFYVYADDQNEQLGHVDGRRFWAARIARISPAYYLALLIALPAYVYAGLVSGMVPLNHFAPALVLVPTLLQSWYPPTVFEWNGPAWSLSVEMFFYAMFPLLFAATNKLTRQQFLGIAFGAVVVTALMRDALLSSFVAPTPRPLLYFPPFHLASFLFGMALGRAFLFGNRMSPVVHEALFILGAVPLLVILGYRADLPAWTLSNAVLVPLFGLLILGAARIEGTLGRALSLPWLLVLGEASYAMYLLHSPLFFWLRQAEKRSGLAIADATTHLALTVLLVICASILADLYVERPLRTRISVQLDRWIGIRTSHR